MDGRKVIVSSNYAQLVVWCLEHKLSPMQVIWANRPEVLSGLEISQEDVVFIGVPHNASAIEEALRLGFARHAATVTRAQT